MNPPNNEVFYEQLRTVQSIMYKHKEGLSLEELKSKLDKSVDAGSIITALVERNVVNITPDQKYHTAFAPPPYPPQPLKLHGPREDRRHEEPLWSTDPRSRFVRDRERIIFSSAFRRLTRVTQVFPAKAAAHNRFTHSIKAGHIARSIMQQLPSLPQNIEKDIDENVVEAAALAHDIGHPPFGHAGEAALDECMADFGGFEGNAQTFRVLTKLSRINPDFRGLNLTRATLNAIIKYPWFRGSNGYKHKKWNVYSTEMADFQFARADHSGKDPSLEARIMEHSDDIAYGVHDIEDGIRAGLIPIHELVSRSGDGYDQLLVHLESKFLKDGQLNDKDDLFRSRDQLVKALGIICLAGRSLTRPFADESDQRGDPRRLTTLLHQRYLLAVSNSLDELEESQELSLNPEMERELKVLKEIMGCFVFGKLLENQIEQKKMIRVLFKHFIAKGNRDRAVFTRQIQDSLAEDERTCPRSEANLARASADQIATMTEDEVLRTYKQIT